MKDRTSKCRCSGSRAKQGSPRRLKKRLFFNVHLFYSVSISWVSFLWRGFALIDDKDIEELERISGNLTLELMWITGWVANRPKVVTYCVDEAGILRCVDVHKEPQSIAQSMTSRLTRKHASHFVTTSCKALAGTPPEPPYHLTPAALPRHSPLT